MSKFPLHGFLFGRRQHLGISFMGIPEATEVAYVIISANFFTFDFN